MYVPLFWNIDWYVIKSVTSSIALASIGNSVQANVQSKRSKEFISDWSKQLILPNY